MSFLEFAIDISIIIVSVSFLLMFIRLAIGPSIEDRIVALDLLSIAAIAFIGIYSIKFESRQILDVGIILSILAFLVTVAFAYYLERRNKK
jgi:multicomponent Na+:H+ antiporter subunit F